MKQKKLNKLQLNKLHAEIWYQFAYTIALLEQGNKLSREDTKEISDKIYDLLKEYEK